MTTQNFNAEAFAKAFAEAYAAAQRPGAQRSVRKQATGPTGSWIQGPGGIFSGAVKEPVISLRIAPRGVSSVLPVAGVTWTNPEFNYITGIEEADGSAEPDSPCETCISGVTQSCIQTAQFGYVCRETKTLTPQRAIERVNQGELPLELVNDILGNSPNDVFAAIRNLDQSTILQVATTMAMVEVGALMQNALVPMVWQGNPANSVGTGYREFPGLDILIGQNKVDAHTGARCEALDSDVKDFEYGLVTQPVADGWPIVPLIEAMEAYLYHNGIRQGLAPVETAICMRPELWYILSEVWGQGEASSRFIVVPTGNFVTVEGTQIRQTVNSMREGMYMFINGRQHPVIVDDGIFEHNSTNDQNLESGEFASSIYFLPLTFLGGRPATLIQHKDYSLITPELAAGRMQNEFWSDDGRFLWTVDKQKWCYVLSATIEPRVVLYTPQLAGRIDHVKYIPPQHFRSPFPGDPNFFKGGVSERPAPSLWSDWEYPR